MNLSNWEAYIRAVIPAATPQSVSTVMLDQILNSGVRDIVKKSKCLKANKKFDVIAGQGAYSLLSVIPDYLISDKSGLFWNNGTEYTQVFAKTLEWLDNFYPNWRSLSNGNPQFYSIDGDILTVVLTPSVTLSNGFWMYYIPLPIDMASGNDFPFVGSSHERLRLRIFDEALEAFCRWKISPILSKDGEDKTQIIYKATLDESIDLFNEKPDLTSGSKMKVPNIC